MRTKNSGPKSRNARLVPAMVLGLVTVLTSAIVAMATPRLAYGAEITVYKSPLCGCCGNWVEYMRARGHKLTVRNMENLDAVKKMAGVPEALRSCHTALVGGYVVEGHVPAGDVARLLAQRPKAKGIAVPGMPMGSPGMEGHMKEPYQVVMFGTGGAPKVFSVH